MPNADAGAKIGITELDTDLAVEPLASQFMRALLLRQLATPDGVIEVLRQEFQDARSTKDYLVPDARWDIILLMRARGVFLSDIAEACKIDFPELLYWFHTPGIVRDIWTLMETEEWERFKVKARQRVIAALDDPEVLPTSAIEVAAKLVAMFQPERRTVTDDDPAEFIESLTRNPMPLPKG